MRAFRCAKGTPKEGCKSRECQRGSRPVPNETSSEKPEGTAERMLCQRVKHVVLEQIHAAVPTVPCRSSGG